MAAVIAVCAVTAVVFVHRRVRVGGWWQRAFGGLAVGMLLFPLVRGQPLVGSVVNMLLVLSVFVPVAFACMALAAFGPGGEQGDY